jgi:hypothetical protein
MIKTVVLLVSLTANLALLGLALRAPAAREAQRAPRPSSGASAASFAAAVDVEREPAAYYGRLLSLGLDETEARLLLLAALEAAAASRIPKPEDHYWQPQRTAFAEYGLAVAAAQTEIRRALETAVGPAAVTESVFARLYRPVDLEFGFLSSAEQIAVRDWRLQRQYALMAGSRTRRGASSQRPAVAESAAAAGLQALAGVLSAETVFEVALRDAPLAELLRSSGVGLREVEFREAYAALAELDSEPPSLETNLAARQRLRTVLGADRFARVWAGRDPAFGSIERIARELGLTDDQALACYGVWLDSQERLMELAARGDVDSESTMAAVRALAEQEERALAAIVGEDAARQLLGARAAELAAEQAARTRG